MKALFSPDDFSGDSIDFEPVFRLLNDEGNAVDLVYLIGMKLTSARGQDLKDVAEILKKNKSFLSVSYYHSANALCTWCAGYIRRPNAI